MKTILFISLVLISFVSSASPRKKYLTEVKVPVDISEREITLSESASDVDKDEKYACELTAEKGRSFLWNLNNQTRKQKLVLTEGSTVTTLVKIEGSKKDGIYGTWSVTERLGNIKTITKLSFNEFHEVKIQKTCILNEGPMSHCKSCP